MDSDSDYPIPPGLHRIPTNLLDLRPDCEIDYDLLHPKPISNGDEKNIWFFWHSGYSTMHPYAQRNIRVWYRRFSLQGWTIRVLDRHPSSHLNVSNFLDVDDPQVFPRAFADGTIGGEYAAQHTSDLVRWPLLLKYGGVYADVGLIQIGDLDCLWNETIGDPFSRFKVVSYSDAGGGVGLTNYFLGCGRDNPFFERCHIFGFSFQIVPLSDDHPIFEDLYKVLGFDLEKIVCDSDGCLVFAPALEGFKYQDTRGGA